MLVNTSRGLASQKSNQARGNRVCFIGTSLINQGARASSGIVAFNDRGPMSWLSGLSHGLIDTTIWADETIIPGWEPSAIPGATREFWGLNAGVSGQTAPQIYDRLDKVLEIPADVYVLDMGTNDIGSAATAEEIHAWRRAAARKLLSNRWGARVVVLTILAREASAWAPESAEWLKWLQVNDLTFTDLARMPEVIIHDWNRRWIDQDSATLQPRVGASNDGTHFAAKGGYWVGLDMIDLFKGLIQSKSNEPIKTILANSTLEGTSGSNTSTSGDVADNFRFERNTGVAVGVASKGVDSAGNNTQILTMTPTGSGGTSKFYFRTNSADVAADVANAWMRSSIRVDRQSSEDSILSIQLVLDDAQTASARLSVDGDDASAANYPSESFSRTYKTPPLQFSETAPSFRWRLEIELDNTQTAPVTLHLSKPWVAKVTDPRVYYKTTA